MGLEQGVPRVVHVGTGDLELVADVWGPPGALPVVLLHGLSQQRRFWAPVVRRMRTRPVAAIDQRGHGASDTPAAMDFGPAACASDVLRLLDALAWPRAVVVGHSWGAAVAVAAAAQAPDRVAAAVLVDGGLWPLSALGPRSVVREQLTPPTLGLEEDDLWAMMRAGSLGPFWSDETQEALAPTFTADARGRLGTALGFERHMLVLDGLLDHDTADDLRRCSESGTPIWAVVCEPVDRAERAPELPHLRIHRWAGAVHDVPLQWPALVAGLVDAVVESEGTS